MRTSLQKLRRAELAHALWLDRAGRLTGNPATRSLFFQAKASLQQATRTLNRHLDANPGVWR